MADRPYTVLFLCTGNSARSILAEALMNQLGEGRLRGFSAGSHPKGAVHPMALELLAQTGMPIRELRSKSWDEFAREGAEPLDFVVTVCDNAAGEVCPYWPGRPVTAHWGLPDPAAVITSELDQRNAFRSTFDVLASHIKALMEMPIDSLERGELSRRLAAIGKVSAPAGR